MMHRGYFIHARKTVDWVFRNNPKAYSVWMYLLETASGVERKAFFCGDEIKLEPGQLVTGRKKISKATGVPESTVERVLDKLEKWTQIEQQKKATSRLIIIRNWSDYQYTGQEVDNKWTTNGQRPDNKRTLIDKEEKVKKVRKKFVPPEYGEIEAYCKERNNNVDPGRFLDHYVSNGWKVGKNPMKDWRASIRQWERGDNEQQKKEHNPSSHVVTPKLEGERSEMPEGFMDDIGKIGRDL